METNILKQIFFDQYHHWEAFKKKHGAKIRPNVIKEVKKFRDCGDMKKGFKRFVCEADMMYEKYLTVVKVAFVPHVLSGRVKSGAG